MIDLDAIERQLTRDPLCSEANVAALVAELRATRTFRDDIVAALRPGRIRGFGGPDGASKDEVIADVANALAAYDKAVG